MRTDMAAGGLGAGFRRRVMCGGTAVLCRVRTPMGRQVMLLGCSLAGVVLGAALIARWAVGVAVIADSVLGVWYALYRDVPDSPRVGELSTHQGILERMRAAP